MSNTTLQQRLAAVHARVTASTAAAPITAAQKRKSVISARAIKSLLAMGYSGKNIYKATVGDDGSFDPSELDQADDSSVDVPTEEVVSATMKILKAMGEDVQDPAIDPSTGIEADLDDDDLDQVSDVLEATIKAARTPASRSKLMVRLLASMNSVALQQHSTK